MYKNFFQLLGPRNNKIIKISKSIFFFFFLLHDNIFLTAQKKKKSMGGVWIENRSSESGAAAVWEQSLGSGWWRFGGADSESLLISPTHRCQSR